MECAMRRACGARDHDQNFMEFAQLAAGKLTTTAAADRLTRAHPKVDSRTIMGCVDLDMLLESTTTPVRTFTNLPKKKPLMHNNFFGFAQGVNRNLQAQDCRQPYIGIQSMWMPNRFAVACAAQRNLAWT
jgi:hypothetical protein